MTYLNATTAIATNDETKDKTEDDTTATTRTATLKKKSWVKKKVICVFIFFMLIRETGKCSRNHVTYDLAQSRVSRIMRCYAMRIIDYFFASHMLRIIKQKKAFRARGSNMIGSYDF